MASEWTIAKDALSFVGGLLVSLPWFLDFTSRVDLVRLKKIPTSMNAWKAIITHQEAWLAAPKNRDLALTSIGLMLVCISFGMALLQSLGVLGT